MLAVVSQPEVECQTAADAPLIREVRGVHHVPVLGVGRSVGHRDLQRLMGHAGDRVEGEVVIAGRNLAQAQDRVAEGRGVNYCRLTRFEAAYISAEQRRRIVPKSRLKARLQFCMVGNDQENPASDRLGMEGGWERYLKLKIRLCALRRRKAEQGHGQSHRNGSGSLEVLIHFIHHCLNSVFAKMEKNSAAGAALPCRLKSQVWDFYAEVFTSAHGPASLDEGLPTTKQQISALILSSAIPSEE